MARTNILVVETSATLGRWVSAPLRRAGFAVRVVPNGSLAKAELATAVPDVLVTGSSLPYQVALGVVRQLRTRSSEAACLMLARRSSKSTLRAATMVGADQTLELRIGAEAMVEVVRGLAQVRELRKRVADLRSGSTCRHRDPVTGFHMLEHLQEVLFGELKRAQRYGFPLALMLVTITSDARHCAPAQRAQLWGGLGLAVTGSIRDTDLPVAIDQEQVLVLMPHTDRAGANTVARRILFRVARSATQRVGASLRPRVAIGIAASTSEHLLFSELVHEANLALAQARERGGNCVVPSDAA